jgi:putative ABC transport system substrate-binding protein
MLGGSAGSAGPAHEETSTRYEAFRQGLRELGYVPGQNLFVEHRSARREVSRLPALASELVQLNVSVLVALEPPAVEAARRATMTIPIVMRSSGDPVELGWVASLARPGANVTGVTSYSTDLYGKKLQLLKETIPALARVAVLWDPSAPGAAESYRRTEVAAAQVGLALHPASVRHAGDLEKAFGSVVSSGAGAVLALRGPIVLTERRRVTELAARHRLPAMYDDREFTEDGGLMSYGTNLEESYRQAAVYVGRILKGAKPADLPVEQPTKFELVVNARAARAIGLTIPRQVLLRADRVIE